MGIMSKSKLRPRPASLVPEVTSAHAQAEKIFQDHFGRTPRDREQVIGLTIPRPYFHVQRGEHENWLPDDDVFVVEIVTGQIKQAKWKDMLQWPRKEFEGGAWRITPPREDGLKEAA